LIRYSSMAYYCQGMLHSEPSNNTISAYFNIGSKAFCV
jgi:hypothetical protein